MNLLLPRKLIWGTWGWVKFRCNWRQLNNFDFDNMQVIASGYFREVWRAK